MKNIKSKTYIEKMAMPMIYHNLRFVVREMYGTILVAITTNDDDDDTVINAVVRDNGRMSQPYPGCALLDKAEESCDKAVKWYRGELSRLNNYLKNAENNLTYKLWDYYMQRRDEIVDKIANLKKARNKMSKYLFVKLATAENGYGPVLYDKCIEIASNMNRQLINSINYDALLDNVKLDDDSVGRTSAEARSVWQKYKQREDIVKHDLPTGEFSLSKPKGGKFFYE